MSQDLVLAFLAGLLSGWLSRGILWHLWTSDRFFRARAYKVVVGKRVFYRGKDRPKYLRKAKKIRQGLIDQGLRAHLIVRGVDRG